MKKHWDKFLLALATLVMTTCLTLSFLRNAIVTDNRTAERPVPTLYPYQEVNITLAHSPNLVWEKPTAQDEEGVEIFDVFTPPRIWWNEKTSDFIFLKPEGREDFGLKLLEIKRQIYPIRLRNISGNKREETIITLYNTNSDDSHNVKLNEGFGPGKKLKIIDFVNTVKKNEKGIFAPVRHVTLYDENLGKSIELSFFSKVIYVPGKYSVKVETSEPYSAKEYLWTDKNSPIELKAAFKTTTFKLLSIGPEAKSIKVRKVYYRKKGSSTIKLVEEETLSLSLLEKPFPNSVFATLQSKRRI